MGVAAVTCWFLTASGWKSNDDRVAVWDAEVWPADTLMVGLLELDGRGRETWAEFWRDKWHPQELDRAVARFGTVPPGRVSNAA